MDKSQEGNLNLVGLDEDNSILLEDSDAESLALMKKIMNITPIMIVKKMIVKKIMMKLIKKKLKIMKICKPMMIIVKKSLKG